MDAEGRMTTAWRSREGDDFVVLADPDGNRFCVVQGTPTGSS
jgi:hypothetical protein